VTNILIPMAGNGQRFIDAGYTEPKPFIDVLGKPMIQRVIESLGGTSAGQYIFVVKKEHDLASRLLKLVPHAQIVEVKERTEGAACTALKAKKWINNTVPLLIANCDQIVSTIKRYEDDFAWIATFQADDPKWSYAIADWYGRVYGVVEKQVVGTHATCGIYYWRAGKQFVASAEQMIARNLRVNGEFYIAPVYNQFIEDGGEVWLRHVERMIGLGTPEDLKAYEDSQRPAVRP
jgi:dTDP-glucose pyrophosphorylase